MQNATIMSYKNIPEEIFQHVLNSVNVSMHHISNSRFNLDAILRHQPPNPPPPTKSGY